MRYWAWTADEVHLALARLTHARMLQAQVEGLSETEQQIMLAHTPVPGEAGAMAPADARAAIPPSNCRRRWPT